MVGRPSNRDERYAQIMAALVRCVARYGIEGATLAKIAEEADLKRPLVRYHLGNKDKIIAALQQHVIDTFSSQNKELERALPPHKPATLLVDFLYDPQGLTDPELIMAFAALTARAVDDPKLGDACRLSILEFEQMIERTILRQYPKADPKAVARSAHGLSALYMNLCSLTPLNMSLEWQTTAYELSKDLLATLKS